MAVIKSISAIYRFLFLSSLVLFMQTISFAMEKEDPEQKDKRTLCLLDTQTSPFITLLNEDCQLQVASFLDLRSLCRLEETSMIHKSRLENSKLYLALILPSMNANAQLFSRSHQSATHRAKFLFLLATDPQFHKSFVSIWLKNFPLHEVLKELPLSAYWVKPETQGQERLLSAHICFLGLDTPPTQDRYAAAQKEYKKIAAQEDPSLPQEKKRALIALGEMEMLGQIHPGFIIAPAHLRYVFENYKHRDTTPLEKVRYTLHRAQTSRFGTMVNYTFSRAQYKSIIKDTNALAEDRALARFELTQMDYFGQGISSIDYISIRQEFMTSRDDANLSDQEKARANLFLTRMDRRGLGFVKPNFSIQRPVNNQKKTEAVRQSYLSVINGKAASPQIKALAEHELELFEKEVATEPLRELPPQPQR